MTTSPPNHDRGSVVVCTVGTDFHPFNRLVDWCDQLAIEIAPTAVHVQYGASRPPAVAFGAAYWDKEALSRRLTEAHVTITHGGPGSISEARQFGTRPIVVPRDPRRGEHVDGHQQRFVTRLANAGVVTTVASAEQLVEEVTTMLARPRGQGLDADADLSRVTQSAQRFGGLVDELLSSTKQPKLGSLISRWRRRR